MKPQALAMKATDVETLLSKLHTAYPHLIVTVTKTETGEAVYIRFREFEQAATLMGLFEDSRNLLYFAPREHIETDESFLQLLPYALVRRGTTAGDVLVYSRPSRGDGEARLRGASSVGFGGHIELEDWHPHATIAQILSGAANRELAEELGAGGCYPVPIAPAGLLIDRTNPVGRVHLGLVYQTVALSEDFPGASQAEVKDLRWLTNLEVENGDASKVQNPENWTAMILGLPLPGEIEHETA